MRTSISLEKLKTKKLSERELLQVGAAYQQLYWQEGKHPSTQEIYDFVHGVYSFAAIEDYIESTEFQEKLIRLGIKSEIQIPGALTPEQIVCANMELSMVDKRSIRQKLESINVTVQQFEAWKRQPAYQEYVATRSKELYDSLESEAYKTLAKLVSSGDLAAAKLILEMKGKYAKNINMNVNVESVVVKIIEIIMTHVDDPQIIEAIARDIEKLDA